MSLRAQKPKQRPSPNIVHCTPDGVYRYRTTRTATGYELRSQNGIAVPVVSPIHARNVAREITEHLTAHPLVIPIPLDVTMPVIGGAK